jgi:hypothetical protein
LAAHYVTPGTVVTAQYYDEAGNPFPPEYNAEGYYHFSPQEVAQYGIQSQTNNVTTPAEQYYGMNVSGYDRSPFQIMVDALKAASPYKVKQTLGSVTPYNAPISDAAWQNMVSMWCQLTGKPATELSSWELIAGLSRAIDADSAYAGYQPPPNV